MEIQINSQDIMEKLARLQADVDFIKNNMFDSDCILDEDDLEALRLAEEEYKKDELVSLEDIKKLREQNVRD